jgi:hypothetical protein
MKKNGWTQRELERLIARYMDKTGKLDWDTREVAEWAEEMHYTMPEPPTEIELLAQLLREAQVRGRRRDDNTALQYRATLSYATKVEGEWQMRWFDSDGPSATAEKLEASARRRREQALNILVLAAADLDHFRRKHPSAQLELFDLAISSDEIQWRLLGRRADDGEQDAAVS